MEILNFMKSCNTSGLSEKGKSEWNKMIKEAEDKIKFVSDLLKRTSTLAIPAAEDFRPTEKSIAELFKLVEQREESNGKPKMHRDDDIWKWFPNLQKGHKPFTVNLFTFVENITSSNILKEGEIMGLKTIHTYREALSIIIQAILDGELDKIGDWKIVFFEIENKEGKMVLRRFYAYRHSDGKLYVGVRKVGPGYECSAGGEAYFSNKETQVLESSESLTLNPISM